MTDDYTPTTAEVREWWAEDQDRTHGMADEAHMAEFDRWLEQYTAEKRAEWEAELDEVEWDYGTRCPMPECTEPHLLDESDYPPQPEESLWRRTKARDVPAGEWVPVNENGATDREDGSR